MSQWPQPEMIATNGVELEVFKAGSGKPVVMCHGWPEHAYSWRHQFGALADAGYHVIAPNQRGYGASSSPPEVEDFDIVQLTGDLVGLLDHYGYEDALFVGHDWGAIVVWALGVLHPDRVSGIINMSVPYLQRGSREWVGIWEELLGPDFYIVHFNRQPGVADAIFEEHTDQFLRNIYRTKQWLEPAPEQAEGMTFLNMAVAQEASGEPAMPDEDRAVFTNAFGQSGFRGPLNWYRNFTRNWHTLADVEERIACPTLMIYGQYDMVPPSPTLGEVVEKLETVTLPCGHWIQQEEPAATLEAMNAWMAQHYPA